MEGGNLRREHPKILQKKQPDNRLFTKQDQESNSVNSQAIKPRNLHVARQIQPQLAQMQLNLKESQNSNNHPPVKDLTQ